MLFIVNYAFVSQKYELNVVAHTYNLSYLGATDQVTLEGQLGQKVSTIPSQPIKMWV
jgi:hypothetical protein